MPRNLLALLAIFAMLATAFEAGAVGCTAANPNASVIESTPTSAFTDNTDGTVTHSLTGLMWKQCAEGLSGAGCATGGATAMTWSFALTTAAADTTAGHSDWRLPNKKELESIVENCGYNPAINQTVFPATPASFFWSGSSYVPLPTNAWNVYFYDGNTYADNKTHYDYYVRLVRGGQLFDSFDSQAADTTPDAFSFTAQTGAALSSVATSNTLTVAGIDSAANISIAGGTYSINGGAYTAVAGTVNNGQTVTVRQTASGSYSTLTTATLTIGGVDGAFNVTTQAALADTTPDAFSFTAQTGAALSSVATSNTLTVAGIDSAANISIAGGTYSINGGAYTAVAGTVNNGQTVTVRQTASGSYSTLTTATLTIGGVDGAFNVTTQAALADTTPDAFSFTAQIGAALSSVATSNTITVAGINSAANISIAGGTYSINGGAYTAVAGTVNNGQTVTVRQTASGSYSTLTTATLTIGGVDGAFNVTTQAAPGAINAPSGVDTTLSGTTPVTAAPGSTLVIPSGANVAGVPISLTPPIPGVASIPVTIRIGNNTLTVTPTSTNAVVTIKEVMVNGVPTLVLAVTSGTVTVSAASGQLIMVINGSLISAGSNGGEINQILNTDGTATLSVNSGYVILSANAFAAVQDNKLYAGEIAQIDTTGKVTQVRLGSPTGSGALVGDPLKLASTSSLTLNVTVPNLKGTVARLSTTQDFGDLIAAALGTGFTAHGQNSQGVLSLSIAGISANALPVGDITIDTSRPDGVSVTGNGKVEVVKSGVITGFVPAVTDLTHLTGQIIALGKNASLTLNDEGVLQTTLNGATYVVQPGWITSQGSGSAGFTTDAQGHVIYQDSNRKQQTLYPVFADLAQLIAAFKGIDAKLSATGNNDGTVTTKLQGMTYTLTPQYALIAVPAAHATDAWWVDGGTVYLKSRDGKTAQGFGVK